MRRLCISAIVIVFSILCLSSFRTMDETFAYINYYQNSIQNFLAQQEDLVATVAKGDFNSSTQKELIKDQIFNVRMNLKANDFWFRYLEPVSYKKINGPLPIEWETEVFEKFEKPYRREGAGFTLALGYLEEENCSKDSLIELIQASISATNVFVSDSIKSKMETYDHFYLCNRLFLLNLASIYTTGFECPEESRVIPELKYMINAVSIIYDVYNKNYPETKLSNKYITLYTELKLFLDSQPEEPSKFDHYTFIRKFVNPLFSMNQDFIAEYKVKSRSFVDYTINKNCKSIFDKSIYYGQNSKGIFASVTNQEVLDEIDQIGKLLFYDPILSGNNQRSCASCHKSENYFTDNTVTASIQFNQSDLLNRNTPSLINSTFNHLIMMDGIHLTLQEQARAVICNPIEMGGDEKEVLEKVLSCREYKTAFKNFLKYTPHKKEVTFEHIISALTFYYSKFSLYDAPFDHAMNNKQQISLSVQNGFNLFMSKAQCATCHFVPQFNGVKPPFVSSEFEVLGVPDHSDPTSLDADSGRYNVNPASEMLFAFRTGSIRNAEYTQPYMHNGIYKNLEEVIDFYNVGGGVGKGLNVSNQTLSGDSLHLTDTEKSDLIAFIKSLNEEIVFELPPTKLPLSKVKALNKRSVKNIY